MSKKNRDGKATEFQRKKLRELGYKSKMPTTYREAEKILARFKRKAKKVIPSKAVPVKGEVEPCKKPVAVKKPSKKPCKEVPAKHPKPAAQKPKIENYIVSREDIVKFGFLLTKIVELGFQAMLDWGIQQSKK